MKQLAILISGTGRTLANLIRKQTEGNLCAAIKVVITDRDCPGIKFAQDANIPVCTFVRSEDTAAHNKSIFDLCEQLKIDYLCCAGFLSKLIVPPAFTNRVLNIHPSLLPAFGGLGMFGKKIHQAVLERGCKLTGCTVHLVDDEYDHGPIIRQASTWVAHDDTPETLAQRVFELECLTYPMCIRDLVRYEFEVAGRTVNFQPLKNQS